MAVELSSPLRMATEADGKALAELVNFAGEGLPLYIWTRLAEPGQDPWELGAQRQAQRAQNGEITVIDEGAGVVAAMTGYPLHEVQPLPDAMPPMFRILQELENEVIGTWYLNVLATYPRARGRGFGALLVRHAEAIAQEEALSGVSIIVADENRGARRLYERLGYAERARKAMIKELWDNPSSEWVLLEKQF